LYYLPDLTEVSALPDLRPTTVKLSDEELERLNRLAARRGLTRHQLMRILLTEDAPALTASLALAQLTGEFTAEYLRAQHVTGEGGD
jgi:Ribbon-helix-helix protein, copG family